MHWKECTLYVHTISDEAFDSCDQVAAPPLRLCVTQNGMLEEESHHSEVHIPMEPVYRKSLFGWKAVSPIPGTTLQPGLWPAHPVQGVLRCLSSTPAQVAAGSPAPA